MFFKHRSSNFYQPSAFILAMIVCRLPFVLIEAALFSCIVYFWVGFTVGAGYFFLFYVIMVSAMLVMAAVFRLNACTSPDLTVANAAGVPLLVQCNVITERGLAGQCACRSEAEFATCKARISAGTSWATSGALGTQLEDEGARIKPTYSASCLMCESDSTGGLVLLILIITSGFAIVRQSIHPYYIWAYYIRCAWP